MQDPPPPPELKDPVRWTKTRLVAGIQGQWGPSQTDELKVLATWVERCLVEEEEEWLAASSGSYAASYAASQQQQRQKQLVVLGRDNGGGGNDGTAQIRLH